MLEIDCRNNVNANIKRKQTVFEGGLQMNDEKFKA